ncbi:MAG: DUF1015 family protein [Nocardioides sp.]
MDNGRVETPPYVADPVRLTPFAAWWLAPRRVGDPSSARVFARPYREVHRRLGDWVKGGRMSRDTEPALYLHEYTAAGITVRGLVGCLDLTHLARTAGERAVFPHEGVHRRQVRELADRMFAMKLNPAPILLVHRGPASVRGLLEATAAGPPDRDFVDHAGQQHRVWAIRDPDRLGAIDAGLAGSRLLLADGHHRYAGYLDLLHRHPEEPGAARGLAMVIDHDETPLFLGPIHRVLRGVPLDDLVAAATELGAVVTHGKEPDVIARLGPRTLVVTDCRRWAAVELALPQGVAAVQLLHEQVLPALATGPSRIEYAHAVPDALALASATRATAVLMPAPDLDQVQRVVLSGRLLPEKATSFQPKPSLGVFIRSLRDG